MGVRHWLLFLVLLFGSACATPSVQQTAPSTGQPITTGPTTTTSSHTARTPQRSKTKSKQKTSSKKSTKSPSPKYQAVNGNPWDYNFECCKYITAPPASFCDYFACIGNFWNGRGYVEECEDNEYSKSGGISGSCSYHDGNLRPLLAP